MNNVSIYLIGAIVVSALTAVLGMLLNVWLTERRKVHNEVEKEITLETTRSPEEVDSSVYPAELMTAVPELPKIPGQYGQLEVIKGGLYQVCFLKQQKTKIGRGTNVDIRFSPAWVSRNHAIIEQRDDRFFISDCGSRNGTTVNGIKIREEKELHEDDKIELGGIELRFSIVEIGQE